MSNQALQNVSLKSLAVGGKTSWLDEMECEMWGPEGPFDTGENKYQVEMICFILQLFYHIVVL